MAKSVKQISIFISSPSDVSSERSVAHKVIEDLNSSFCLSQGITLLPLSDYNVYSSAGKYPQDVINQQIGDYDIFVGIMANRFGTPTPKAGSGTEEEFNIAYENRSNTHIMFFFKDAPTKPSLLDADQLKKVKKFKKKIAGKGVLYKEFSNDFESMFRANLTMLLVDKFLNKTELEESSNLLRKTIHERLEFETALHSLRPMYDKCSSINVLAFRNSQLKLKDIYVAQTLVKEKRYDDDQEETTRIDRFPVELIQAYKRILITDTAGMGKSTILKFMFIDLYDKEIKEVGIPIYIELNKLNKNHTIVQEIKKVLNLGYKGFDNESFIDAIQAGGFVFFMDGYDEISIADEEEVVRDIQSFIFNAGIKNFFILASRPEGDLACFGDFQSFKIKPLTKDEAFDLLEKYDVRSNKKISAELIKELETGKYNSIYEYLENPLLVSLLYNAFSYKAEIPLKKHIFYDHVYSAFFDAHDLAKGIRPHKKHSGLDKYEFGRVLKCVGFTCYTKIGVKFNENTIYKVIKNAKKHCMNLVFKELDFLEDLLLTVPLFSRDGNEYKWAHKSLMEYFAARYIADESSNKEDDLKEIYNNVNNILNYRTFLDLYYDIDYKGFSKSITLPFLEAYVKFYDDNFPKESEIEKDLIEARIGLYYYFDKVGIKRNEFRKGYYYGKGADPFVESLGQLYELRARAEVNDYYGLGRYVSERLNVISDLIRKKQPELFRQYRKSECYSKKKDFFRENKFYSINVMTGDDDVALFVLINEVLSAMSGIDHFTFYDSGSDNNIYYLNYFFQSNVFDFFDNNVYYLNHEAVTKEIKKIKNEIIKTSSKTLYEGL